LGVTRIEVQIDELVLHGLDQSDGWVVERALRRALAARFARSRDLGATRAIDELRVPPVRLPAGHSPSALGRAAAARMQEGVGH
jgi:hypothetical protein